VKVEPDIEVGFEDHHVHVDGVRWVQSFLHHLP